MTTEIQCPFFDYRHFNFGNYLWIIASRIFFFRNYCVIGLLWTSVVGGTPRFFVVYFIASILVMLITPFFQTCKVDDDGNITLEIFDRISFLLDMFDCYLLFFIWYQYFEKMKLMFRHVSSSRFDHENVALLSPMDSAHKHKT